MFRFAAAAIFLGALVISTLHRWRARAAGGVIRRSEEPRILIAGRILFAVPLIAGPALWIANPRLMEWSSFGAPAGLRWVGVSLGVLVLCSAHWVLKSIGANVSETVLTKKNHQLVMHGPYRWVRHPLYATGIALYLALGLIAANWFMLTCSAIAAIAIRLFVVPREERALIERFGDAYRQYRQRTGALTPTIGRSVRST